MAKPPILSFRDLPAHVQLMLLSARTKLRPDELKAVRELTASPQLDWAAFLAVTLHHKLGSLAFESLDRIRPEGLPDFVREELQRRSRINAFEAMRSAAEVRRIAERFAAEGIELGVLKGVPLSQMLFGTPHARHVGDIDLLTAPRDLQRQIDLFAELGYPRIGPKSPLTPRRIINYVHFWKDFTFKSTETRFEVDLHWRLFNNRFHAANRLVSEPCFTSTTVFGTPMRVFCPVEQFLYTAAHGVFDAWIYLKSLADFAAFLRLFSPEELDRALLRAEEVGLLAQVSGAIHLANDWMGARIENPRLLPADEPVALGVRNRTTATLLRQDFKPTRNDPTPGDWLRLEMELVPGARSLLELTGRFIFRPRVWKTFNLPDQLFWLYFLLGIVLPPRVHPLQE